MTAIEVNLDGIVGPTHNYAGLSFGNVASEKYAKSVSNPKAAALQGLYKMKLVSDLGIPQLVMPPQPRPQPRLLRQLGFSALPEVPPTLLHQLFSASSMWAANAATVSPSADTQDGKVHFTPANLVSNFHRSQEAPVTAHYLRQIFNGDCFVHHEPLPAQSTFADEGAANHMRLCKAYGERGLEVFVYGGASKKYPARQTRQSVEAIARLHGLEPSQVLFLEQNPDAIDAGVFHNDVIAMSDGSLLVYHERAFTSFDASRLGYNVVCIPERDLPMADAVSSYFFNSQLLTLSDGGRVVIAPAECEQSPKSRACFERFVAEGHISKVYYLDLRESMKNGGGPACLRLRIVLTTDERKSVHNAVWLTDSLYHSLCGWIEDHYRDRIAADDLRDPSLVDESSNALEKLSEILKMDMEAA